ncbi:MAG: lysophospholipid acyltransferase family protein [Gemmataceae bacterium]|nr:lysophospholipid acyltransferase family protein [Gemmataceae bacterium]
MAKERRPIVDYAVYLAVRLAVTLVQAVPQDIGRAFARLMARLAYRIDRRHRDVAKDNLRHAFPGRYSEAALSRIVLGVYQHFLTLVIEIAWLPRKLHVDNWRRYIELVGADKTLTALTSGRPALIVTGHFGNWEMAGFALGLLGFKTFAVARVLDNPHLERFLKQFRQKTGQKILAKKGDFDHMQELLATGAVIATLADQDAGPRGQFVDYFGRPASTFKSVALLSIEYRVPIVVIGVPKVGEPMQYRIEAVDAIDPDEYADRPDAIKAITQRYTSALEGIVRRYPEQYFWLHRRWKSQPPVRKAKAA